MSDYPVSRATQEMFDAVKKLIRECTDSEESRTACIRILASMATFLLGPGKHDTLPCTKEEFPGLTTKMACAAYNAMTTAFKEFKEKSK